MLLGFGPPACALSLLLKPLLDGSTALDIAAAQGFVECERTLVELREKLWLVTNTLQAGLKERGFDIGVTNTMVTPVYLKGDLYEATALTRDLRETWGIFCSIVVYPVIPKGLILLRLIPTATHSLEDVQRTLDAYSAMGEKLKAGHYREAMPVV